MSELELGIYERLLDTELSDALTASPGKIKDTHSFRRTDFIYHNNNYYYTRLRHNKRTL